MKFGSDLASEFRAWTNSLALSPDEIKGFLEDQLRPKPKSVFTVEIPLPPTMNEILALKQMPYAAIKKKWTAYVNEILRRENCPIFEGEVYSHIEFHLNNVCRDQDNTKSVEKFLWDGAGKKPSRHQSEWQQFIIDDRLAFVQFPTYEWHKIKPDSVVNYDHMVVNLSSEPLARVILWR